jgi:hypothetical protein
MEKVRALLVLLPVAGSIGCGGADEPEPADLAGDYTLTVTNQQRGCPFDGWEEGASSSGIPLTITQSGTDVTGVLEGLPAVFFDLWIGSSTLTGEVDGDWFEMTVLGTDAKPDGGCEFTTNATMTGTIAGDALDGTIEYAQATNGDPDCEEREGCSSLQAFNGTRPPE